MSAHRFGLVGYLNTAPYRHGLRALGETDWIEETPAALLPRLLQGEVEAAILPTFDALTTPDLRVLPSACISSMGEAGSVKIFSRVPLPQVAAIALDTSSHTSAAVVRILCAERDLHPVFLDLPPDLPKMLQSADAALLLGDPCMRVEAEAEAENLLTYDVGAEWLELTGSPLVFAVWCVGPRVDAGAVDGLIRRALEMGLEHLEEAAAEEAKRLGFERDLVSSYLRDNMRYRLDGPARVGVEKLRKLLVKHHLVEDHGPVRYELDETA